MESSATRPRNPGSGTRATGGSPVDPPADRPGVPMDSRPAPADGASWAEPPRQEGGEHHLRRAGLPRLTPVWGSAQPPRGVSGALRRGAYAIPEHFARHWMLLVLADRVDVLEDRVGDALAEPFEHLGLETAARHARGNPLAMLAGTALGVWVASRIL